MKFATWNVNSIHVRLPQILKWMQEADIDVLALQETKTQDAKFPSEAFKALGYHVIFSGQVAYNGVAFVSRHPPTDIAILDAEGDGKRMIAASFNGVRVVNLYVVNGQAVDSEKYTYKLHWLDRAKTMIKEQLSRYPELLVVGDFNIALEDSDVHDPEEWRDKVLCSVPERESLQDILGLGLSDTFRLHHQDAADIFSWWPYWRGSFRRNRGVRIDLILASEPMLSRCATSVIDKTPRGWERPSDHAPAVADFHEA